MTPADLHHSLLTVDTHCDTTSRLAWKGFDLNRRYRADTLLGGDVDLPRMAEGGLKAAFFAVYVPQGPRTAGGFAQAKATAGTILDRLDRLFLEHPDACARATAPGDAAAIAATGRRAIFLGMENGYPLGLDLDLLDRYHGRGVRYLTLCHATDNDLCASCTAYDGHMIPRTTPDTGLTEFGARVVARLNRLGMMVDVSHLSERTVDDVLTVSRAPVLASHSGARALGDHPRNLTDRQLRAIARAGGVVQVVFVPEFIRPVPRDLEGDLLHNELWSRVKAHYASVPVGADPARDAALEEEHQDLCRRHPQHRVSVADVADHIDQVARVAGIDHVGIGSDFDGGARMTDCRDVSELPALTAELVRRGYTEADLGRIWGGNLLRVFGEVQARGRSQA